MIKTISHLGIAVADLKASVAVYRNLLGVEPDRLEDLPDSGVRVALFRTGNVEIELFEPLGDKGDTIHRFLAKRGDGIHHICGEVDDLAAELKRLEEMGFTPVGPPRRGAAGRMVAFLRPINGVLFELSERQ